MRIFRFYTFTLEKGTKPCQVIETIAKYLNDNNLKYMNLYYHFDNFIHEKNRDGEYNTGRKTESIAKLCDENLELNPFHRIEEGYGKKADISILSDYSEDWKMISGGVSDHLILQIVSKIPRTYNFCDSKIIFDGVNFTDNEFAPLGSYADDLASASNIPLGSYISYDRDGVFIRWHMLSLCVDVTEKCDFNSFVEQQYIEKLKIAFPIKLLADKTFYAFSREEKTQYEAINVSISDIVSRATSACRLPLGKLADCAKADKVLLGGNYSLKKSLTKLIPLHGYAYQKYHYYMYTFVKKDQFGHQIQFSMVSSPLSRDIQTSFTYRGFGFHYDFDLPMFTPRDQQEADQYVDAIMEFMDSFEVNYLSIIGAAFPAIPAIPMEDN